MMMSAHIAPLSLQVSVGWLLLTLVLLITSIALLLLLLQSLRRMKHLSRTLKANMLEHAKVIEEQKKQILDSIAYAKRIQLAIQPPAKIVERILPDSFILYKPKDVVSGDFYWVEEREGMILFAAVDCTGHGVPGAMMSVVGLNLLNQAVNEKGLTLPADILQHLDKGVTDTLRQSRDLNTVADGMDLSLCRMNPKTLELDYAGAFNNLWLVRPNIKDSHRCQSEHEVFHGDHFLEVKADKFPIGSNLDGVADTYTNHRLQLMPGDMVYLYSDGYADQFGGEKGKKFKYNPLKDLLVSLSPLPVAEQQRVLDTTFESWRGNNEQTDDVLLIGWRIAR